MQTRNSSKQLTDLDIHEFEKKFHVRLPQDYREFMLKSNGGRPTDDWGFDFIEAGSSVHTSSVICDFLALNADSGKTYDDLGKTYKMLVEERQIPPEVLPFANDPGGNYICISTAKGDHGRVCFCNHELEDPETGYMIVSPIADSFSEFIDKCYLCVYE